MDLEAPAELFRSKRGKGGGGIGVIGKLQEGGEPCHASDISKAKKKHSDLGLHKWCVQEIWRSQKKQRLLKMKTKK